MNREGPWVVGRRVYRDWSRVPPWFRRKVRTLERRERARRRYGRLLGQTSGWRRTALGLVVGAGVTLGIAELLWKL